MLTSNISKEMSVPMYLSMGSSQVPPTPPTPSTVFMFSAPPTPSPTAKPPLSPYSPPLSSTSTTFGARVSIYRTTSVYRTATTIQMPDDEFSDQDLVWAKALMSEHCSNKGRKSKCDFNYKDANAVLARIADGQVPGATPALIHALQTHFNANASIQRRKSTNLFKVMAGRDQEDIRSNVLEKAVMNCTYDIVGALAMKADQDALDRALPFAIKQNDTAKVLILMQRHANAEPLHDEFLQAVDCGPEEMLALLLKESNGACETCKNKGLVKASTSGNLPKVQMLLEAKAKATHDDAAALRAAILGGHEDIAVTLASGPEMASFPLRLDAMVKEAFNSGQDRALTACLQSGAKGPLTDEVLLEAVKQRRSLRLIQTLVQHGASVEHREGAVIHAAIQSRSSQMLETVLRGRPSKSIICSTVDTLASVRSIQTIIDMVSALLPLGLDGDPINRLLSISLQADALDGELHARSSLVQLLVQRGHADVNFNGGQPLILAAAKGWLEILSVLLSSPASLPSLRAAVAAAVGIADTKIRFGIVERILNAAGMHRQFLELTVFQLACKSLDLSLLQLLPHSSRSPEEVLAGFQTALLNPRWLTSSGLPIIRALLHSGANGPDVCRAFCQAAQNYERDAFELFAAYVDLRTIVEALQIVIQASKTWLAPDNKYLWLIHSLLEWGARGREQANHAFLITIEEYLAGRCSDALVETLLSVGHADVNFQSGKALKFAVWAGNFEVFKMLLCRGATMKTIESVFFEVMVAAVSEDTALSFIDILTSADGPNCVNGFKKLIPQLQAPVRSCLAAHPDSVKLIKRLIKLGVKFDVEEPTTLYGKEFGPERCTTLLWSLLPRPQGTRPIEPKVIQALIDAKVNVNFVSPISETTALILAAHFGHADTVGHLIKAGANTRLRDRLNCSALFYASRKGYLNIVKSLLKSPYKTNDGSLHEAARNLHADVCTTLIKTGKFDVNYPSSDHQGRTPVNEMAHGCDGMRSQVHMEETLIALKSGGLDPFTFPQKPDWKNALFLALENPRPFSITQALLDVLWWQDINSDQNVFTIMQPSQNSGNMIKCHYSPTMYLKYLHYPKSEKEAEIDRALGQMLRDKGAEDRLWSDLALDQPTGAVGYPEAIAKEIKRLDRIQREHNERLRLEGEAHNHKLFLEQTRHDQKLAQESQSTMQKVQSSTIMHESKLQQDAEVTLQQQQALQAKNYIAHEGRILANQDRAAQVAVDNNGLAQKHHINENHQQFMDFHKLQMAQAMDYQKFRQTQAMDQQKLYQTQMADRQKLMTQERTDWQKVAAMQAVDNQKLLAQTAQDKQKFKAMETTNKHKISHLHKLEKEKRENAKKNGEQQVKLKKSLAKLASKEDQRKLDYQHNLDQEKLNFQYGQAEIKLFTQMAQNHIDGPGHQAQGKVVKQKGPKGYIENGEA